MRLKHHIGSILLVIGAILVLYVAIEMHMTKQTFPSFDNVLSVSVTSPSPTQKPTIVGWIKETEEENALTTLATSSGIISTIHPQWYQLTQEGELDVIFSPYKADIIQAATESNISIVPSLTDHEDASRTSRLLVNSELQTELITQLIQTAKTQEFAGYNLEFNVLPEQGEDYTAFVKKLQTALAKDNRTLSLTVPAKAGKGADSLESTSFDWVSLGQLADIVHIKLFNKPEGQHPLFNNNYYRDIIAYAKTTIPNEKISLVFPMYSLIQDDKTYTPISYKEMISLLKNNRIMNDPISPTRSVTIGIGLNQKHIYIEDGESILARINLAKENGIYTIGLWYIGIEDTNLWRLLTL